MRVTRDWREGWWRGRRVGGGGGGEEGIGESGEEG